MSKKTDSTPIYIGTMSGTSMDGLDMVAIRFRESALPETLGKLFTPYPDQLKHRLQRLALDQNVSVNQMCLLDTELGQFYAQQINRFIDMNGFPRQELSAIGSHGQTIRHSIQGEHPYTLQIGDPNIIAAKTGLTVVADFRRRDVALNGQGAPLAPAFHNMVFRDAKNSRVVINIGGIANITFLPSAPDGQVVGFDSGPGNTLLDYLCQQKFNSAYDKDGAIASKGLVQEEQLLKIIEKESYFSMPFPKSTGTDYFSPDWLQNSGLLELQAEDCMSTLAALTARTIASAVKSLSSEIDEYYICGGGVHNKHLVQNLQQQLNSTHVYSTEKLGIHPDWVEASAFAWLAQQTLDRKPGNLPTVTNAEKFTILGAVYF